MIHQFDVRLTGYLCRSS